jgi:monoamine oxidase
MAAIRKIYPNAPNYIIYKRSNWGLDPYALGSYPFLKAGATPNDCTLYQEFASTGNKLFFAGDGVSCDLIGTTHGAYLTGVEAANRAIKPVSSAITLFASLVSILAVVTMFAF